MSESCWLAAAPVWLPPSSPDDAGVGVEAHEVLGVREGRVVEHVAEPEVDLDSGHALSTRQDRQADSQEDRVEQAGMKAKGSVLRQAGCVVAGQTDEKDHAEAGGDPAPTILW